MARADADGPGPELVRQILLPSFDKSDWQGSSYSDDGHLFLVIDDSRSFFLDVKSGRELRAVKTQTGESLIWARPRPNSYQWIAVTNNGRFVRVDASNGNIEPILNLDDKLGPSSYRAKSISFELISPDEIVAFVRTLRERPNPDGGTYRWYDQALLSFDLQSGRMTGFRAVSSDEFFTNLDALLVANRDANLVAVFDPKTSAPITLWKVNSAQDAEHFSLSCSVSRSSDDYAVALVPYHRGFVAFEKQPRATYLGPESFNTPACKSEAASQERTASLDRMTCRWNFEGDPVVTAVSASVEDEFIVVRKTLDLDRVRFSVADCASNSVKFSSVKDFYYPWQMAKALNVKPDEDLVEGEQINIKPIPDKQGYSVNAAGGLVWVQQNGESPRAIVELLGNPTGVLELDAASGLLVGARVLGPLKVFDVEGSRLRSIQYDYATYYEKAWVYNKPYAIAGAIGAVAVLEFDGRLTFHVGRFDVDATKLPKPDRLKVERPAGLCSSDDGNRIVVLAQESLVQYFQRSAITGTFIEVARLSLGSGLDLFKIACDAKAAQVAVADSLTDKVFILEVRGSRLVLLQTLTVKGSSNLVARPSFSRDALLLGVGAKLFVRADRSRQFTQTKDTLNASRLVFSDDGRQMLAIGEDTALYRVARAFGTPKLVLARRGFGSATDGGFFDEQNVVLVRSAEELEVRSASDLLMGQLSFGDGEDWVFTDGSGHFDLNDIEKQTAGYWVMPDDPFRALAPEIFMRDYYEPRLLKRLIECHKEEPTNKEACSQFRNVRTVTSINRVQPEVEIVSVEAEKDKIDEVAVTVAITSVEGRYGAPGQERVWQSGVYDLRLFRAGQLVRQVPEIDEVESLDSSSEEWELKHWRESRRLVDKPGRLIIEVRHVRVPLRAIQDHIEFSAYAFNEDRVKSQTTVRSYEVRHDLQAPRHAYLIAVGVSAYESPEWDLRYADNDARRLPDVLVPRLAATGTYDEIVTVLITSSWSKDTAGTRSLITSDATKKNIESVLAVLSGAGRAEDLPAGLVARGTLRKAGPDDLVLILYSSHGYADQKGNFYVFPYDIGNTPGKKVSAEILARAISSAELSLWLRNVDAGETVLIIDACHSAASVEGSGFKPGPMGARGLGQLSYDKGMRILASTRADDLAWESESIREGLLSFALLQEGLVEGKADYRPTDGTIGIGEWLSFGAERVPQLYKDDRTMGSRSPSKLTIFDSRTRASRRVEAGGRDVTTEAQQPALFNYRRGSDPILVRK